ncbi:MAG: hypothetical protein FRX48_03909 [Lasallia pustulata]|uniref:Uncharacterized protein n=1 Tax=Lasallia pustulata TaxID=136370 RepID=A0A5M8PTK3_9LECA|nr:MAG: hypothetical protein FRX48_03909 [Lasallia pustulata]
MGLSCKHDIQEFIYAEQPLKQDHIHSHWWLDPLADIQPVDPITLIQNPIRVCRRGRPNDASVRRDLSQWELALNQPASEEVVDKVVDGVVDRVVGEDVEDMEVVEVVEGSNQQAASKHYRLRNMRPWGQGGQQALSYQGIPDDMVSDIEHFVGWEQPRF